MEGFAVGRCRVRRLMKKHTLQARYPERFKTTTQSPAMRIRLLKTRLTGNLWLQAPERNFMLSIQYNFE